MAAKRTRKLLAWALSLCTSLGFSQTTFQKTIGGAGNETATFVAAIGNGFIVAGSVTNTSGNQDALLLRLDDAGNPVWQKRFGAAATDVFNSVVSTPDGGFLAAGETRSFGAGNTDILLIKVDANGTFQWCKTIGDATHDDVARNIITVPGGGFLLSGYASAASNNASSSIFVRLDANGNTIWSKTFNSSMSNMLFSNYIDGNVIYASGSADAEGVFMRLDLATGSILSSKGYAGMGSEGLFYQQPTQDGNLVLADHTWSAPTGTDIETWVQKINKSTGEVLWSKVYYRLNDNIRGRIEKVSDGGFLLVPYDHFNTAQADALLAKIDANGNLLWSYNYGGNASDRLVSAVQTSDGGFIAVGDTRSNSANANSDILIVKTNAEGHIQGACQKDAGLQAANYLPVSVTPSISGTAWIQNSGGLSTVPLPINLMSQTFTPNAAPHVLKTIPLCQNVSYTIGGVAYYAPKMVTDTVSNVNGCDTIVFYDLTLTPFNMGLHVIGLCAGETYTIDGVAYSAPATVIDTIPSTNGGCDTLCSFVLKAWAQPTAAHTITFCAGETVMIGGQVYEHSGTIQVNVPSLTGGCDTLVTYTLIERPRPTRSMTIRFCPGETVMIGGNTYSQPGTVLSTIPSTTGGCDTLVTYTLELKPQPTRTEIHLFCPGQSVTIAGQTYSQSGTVIVNIPAPNGGCDTVVTHTLELRAQPTRAEIRSFCPGQAVIIAGQAYTQPGIVVANVPSTTGGCDTIVTYTLEIRPQPTRAETRSFCAGQSVVIAGQSYDQPGTVIANIASSTGGCDTIVTYTLELRPQPTRAETRSFCPGESVIIAGQPYTQPGIVMANLPGNSGACDTLVTYTLVLRPQPTRSEIRSFCQGQSVVIAGQSYNQPGTVIANIAATNGGCDTIVTYTLVLAHQPTRSEIRGFCPGETITIAGTSYTQPGTVLVNYPSTTGGCDTIVTYILQNLTPAPSNIAIHCPDNISMLVAAGDAGAHATFGDPLAASDCICPGLSLQRTSGPASGSLFPVGSTQVCYNAKDNCGQEKPCCFSVNVREEDPCDVKENACVKYELLSITSDVNKNLTYRIRVTNKCANKLIYTAFEIPDGLVTLQPENSSIYLSPDGRKYAARTPNYSPMYSVRFKSTSDSISQGQSDIFEYTLPAQAAVTYISVTSRLATTQVLYEAHLNTFHCPVGLSTVDRPVNSRDAVTAPAQNTLLLFPNPSNGVLFADLSDWQGQKLQVNITNAQGQVVHSLQLRAEDDLLRVEMPATLTPGVYFFEITSEKGEKEMSRFVLQR